MRSKKFLIGFTAILAIFTMTLFVASTWAATQEKVLYSFNPAGGADGAAPWAGVIFDTAGNLYGTTSGNGTVFELTPTADGGWTEKVLHQFQSWDGSDPEGGLVFDAAGNLYGTTAEGTQSGWGTVFELTPVGGGNWTMKTLHSFESYSDGAYPTASLIFDAAGNLYGTTEGGPNGLNGGGMVFQLVRSNPPGENWTEGTLHSFGYPDGAHPYASLVFDRAGNLYGTTAFGGAYGGHSGYGIVFELTPSAGGGWTETVLHNFNFSNSDGPNPLSTLIIDAAGNLYGTTSAGGTGGAGTVFELTALQRAEGGRRRCCTIFTWHRRSCSPRRDDQDAAGNLYGTTSGGGTHGAGTVFRLKPTGTRAGRRTCSITSTRWHGRD